MFADVAQIDPRWNQEDLEQEKARSQKFADRLHQLGINLDEL